MLKGQITITRWIQKKMKIIFDHKSGHVIDNKVFCEAWVKPEGESEDFLLENGWLPAQPPVYWYQSQSVRINHQKVELDKKQLKTFKIVGLEIFEYNCQESVDKFFSDFFETKKFEMKDFYEKNSQYFKLQVMCLTIGDRVVGYTRFLQFENSLLGFESAYALDLPKHSLGKNSILLLSHYAKEKGIDFLYIYEAYKDFFPHKFEITGVEVWDGEKWVDPEYLSS